MPYDRSLFLLQRYEPKPEIWEIQDYIGYGNSGCVYRLRLDDQTFNVKIFDHYNPELLASKLKAVHKALRYNTFLAECRAYGQVAGKGRNGDFLAFCHGWIKIPQVVTEKIARDLARKGIFLEQPSTVGCRLRGILLDHIEGEDLSEQSLDAKSIEEIEKCVMALHNCGITHGDLNRSNIRRTTEGRVFLLDLGSSITFPHPTFSESEMHEQEFKKWRQIDWSDLASVTKKDHSDMEMKET